MRRVQRASDKEDLVKTLTTGENAPFREIWRLLLFAAALGFHEGKRIPLGGVDAGKAMPQTYFSNNPAWPGLQYLLALVTVDDANVLAGSEEEDDRRLTIFEEYANGGLELMQGSLESSSYSLEALIGFVAKCIAVHDTSGLETVTI